MAERMSFEEEAREAWVPGQSGRIKNDQLTIGCLQRIGTALERIAKVLEAIDGKLLPVAPVSTRLDVPRREWGKVAS